MRIRRLTLCLALAALAVTFAACGGAGTVAPGTAPAPPAAAAPRPKLTAEKYRAVEVGTFYYDVCMVIGFEGEEVSRNKIGDTTTVLYVWHGDLGTSMTVTFQNDRVVSKSQAGLR